MNGNQRGSLQGKVALITGGGTGIGSAIVDAFVAEGARAFIIGRRTEPLEQVAGRHDGHVAWLAADVSIAGDAARAVRATLQRFERLDILINNAAAGSPLPLQGASDEAIDQALSINVAGPLRFIRESLEPLGRSKGQIINIGSTLANGAIPGTLLSSAAKAAMYQATRVLAAEVGPLGIRVNAVAPGPTETEQALSASPPEMVQRMREQAPFGRLGTPQDIARAVVLMARDEAAWITGQVVDVSGGLMM